MHIPPLKRFWVSIRVAEEKIIEEERLRPANIAEEILAAFDAKELN